MKLATQEKKNYRFGQNALNTVLSMIWKSAPFGLTYFKCEEKNNNLVAKNFFHNSKSWFKKRAPFSALNSNVNESVHTLTLST